MWSEEGVVWSKVKVGVVWSKVKVGVVWSKVGVASNESGSGLVIDCMLSLFAQI